MLKVGFLPLYDIAGPSSRYRVFQFIEPLNRRGFKCSYIEAPQRNSRKRLGYLPRLFNMATTHDVLYVQKRTFPNWVLRILHRLNPHIVFDIDDAIYLQTERQRAVNAILRLAKLVVLGNKHLAKYVRKYNQNVTIIPSVVDTKFYLPPSGPRHPHDKRLVIGWIGTDPNRGDLEQMKPVFDWLSKHYGERIVLRTIGRRPLEMETRMRVEFIPWTLEGAHKALREFDIGIMPLDDTEWNRGKCGLKLIQYMAVRAPAVASPVGVNQEILQDGGTGFLAETTNDWQKSLGRLIQDKDLRLRMGKKGRKRVEQHFSVEVMVPKMIDALLYDASKEGNGV